MVRIEFFTQPADYAVGELRAALEGWEYTETSVVGSPDARATLRHLNRQAPCVVIRKGGCVYVATGNPGQLTEALRGLS